MAGKNTAGFGIYPTYSSVEGGVDALKAAGFRNTDAPMFASHPRVFLYCFRKTWGRRVEGLCPQEKHQSTGGRHGWDWVPLALAIPGLGPFIAAADCHMLEGRYCPDLPG